MKSLTGLLIIGAIALGGSACDNGEQAKAQEAQREAEAKARDADREAAEKKAEAEREASAARAKAEAARTEARATLQKDIAAADRKAMDLKERTAKLKGKAKLNGQAASQEFDKRRAVVDKDLQQLNTQSGSAWDELKLQTERDIDALEESVDSFDKTLAKR